MIIHSLATNYVVNNSDNIFLNLLLQVWFRLICLPKKNGICGYDYHVIKFDGHSTHKDLKLVLSFFVKNENIS